MTTAARGASVRFKLSRVGHFLLHELREMLPPTLFFLVGFGIILFTRRLVLSEYLIEVTGYMLAAGSALIVGKAVLVADALPFLRRFDDAPPIQPILFKTVVYTVIVFFARLVEDLVGYLIGGRALGGFAHHMIAEFEWQRFVATQIWIAVLFLLYTTFSELDAHLGEGGLAKVLFTRRPSGSN